MCNVSGNYRITVQFLEVKNIKDNSSFYFIIIRNIVYKYETIVAMPVRSRHNNKMSLTFLFYIHLHEWFLDLERPRNTYFLLFARCVLYGCKIRNCLWRINAFSTIDVDRYLVNKKNIHLYLSDWTFEVSSLVRIDIIWCDHL